MLTLFFLFLVLGSAIVAGYVAVILWFLVKAIYGEILDFLAQYHYERVKCNFDDDDLFSKWVEEFHAEPLSMMREYADAH